MNNLLIFLSICSCVFIANLIKPAVLGQIIIGIALSILGYHKLFAIEQLIVSKEITFLAELGSIFLLFEIGLETSFNEIKSASKNAIITAITGVIIPFIVGFFVVTPLLFKAYNSQTQLFIAAVLSVTSTSIALSILKELGLSKHSVTKIILTASIIDDIIGLVLLSVITSLGAIDLLNSTITFFKMIFCLSIVIFLSIKFLPIIVKFYNKNCTLVLICYCFFTAFVFDYLGLNSIIGSFVAGIIINQTINNMSTKEIYSYSKLLIPIFFIHALMQINIMININIHTLILTTIISFFAVVTKGLSSTLLPLKSIYKQTIALAMIARGEIGIIFAVTGLKIGVINSQTFTVIMLMIVVTSIIPAILLPKIMKEINN